jgi:hypothetical protein
LQCNHEQLKKGDNSNLIDCNAIAQNKKGRQLQFNRLQWNRKKKIKKGGNSNLIDCNAITKKRLKKGGNPNLIDCNAIVQNKKREITPI